MRISTLLFLLLAAPAVAAEQAPRPPQAPAPARSPHCVCDDCQCSPCHCEPLPDGEYRWVETPKPDQVALYKGDRQLGNYWRSEGVYRRLVTFQGADTWLVQQRPAGSPSPPVAAPVQTLAVPYAPIRQAAPYRMAAPSWGGSCST